MDNVIQEIYDDLEEASTTIAEQLLIYVEEAMVFERRIAGLEDTLKKVKEEYKSLMYNEFPSFFVGQGIKEFRTTEGRLFALKTYVNAKPGEEFFKWIEGSGNSDVVKKNITINVKGYDASVLKEILEHEKLSYSIEEKVHPMTLNSIVKRAIEDGESIPENAIILETGNFVKLT